MAKTPKKPAEASRPTNFVDELEFDPLPFEADEPNDGETSNTDPLPAGTANPDDRGVMAAESVDFLEFSVPAERALRAFKEAGSRLPSPARSTEREPEESTGYTTEQIVAGYPNLDSQKVVEEFRRRRQTSRAQKQRLTK